MLSSAFDRKIGRSIGKKGRKRNSVFRRSDVKVVVVSVLGRETRRAHIQNNASKSQNSQKSNPYHPPHHEIERITTTTTTTAAEDTKVQGGEGPCRHGWWQGQEEEVVQGKDEGEGEQLRAFRPAHVRQAHG
ncbi:hypothetical protein NFJ02_14g16230 [Pycnococcus provasolii]